MRVMCINNKPIKGRLNQYLNRIKEMGEYTVEKVTYDIDNQMGYLLSEVSTPNHLGYAAERFVVLLDDVDVPVEKNELSNY